MNLKRIIKIFYMAYTLYAILLIGASTIGIANTLPAIIILWINYFYFTLGYRGLRIKKRYRIENNLTWLFDRKKKQLFGIAILSIACSLLAVYYYTGQTPMRVFYNLTHNVSVYNEYQRFFKEHNRGAFSIVKVPFIFMMFYVKAILFYSYVAFFMTPRKKSIVHIAYLALLTIAHVYIGISRGTSFEIFELVILVFFLVFSNADLSKIRKLNLKPIIISGIIGLVGLNYFFNGIRSRGVKFNPEQVLSGVNFNMDGWLTFLSPALAEIVFRLYAYFGFGIYYISSYFHNLWFVSLPNIISGLLPLGYNFTMNSDITTMMNDLIYVGVKWHPDFIKLNNLVGYLGVLVICFLLGGLSRYFLSLDKNNPIVGLTSFLILLQMVSFPAGNFLFASSANQLILLFAIAYWFWRIIVVEVISAKKHRRVKG